MKRIIFSLALSIAMIVTAMAQEIKPMVKASSNATPAYETIESSNGGFWSDRPYIKGARFNAYFDFGLSVGGYSRYVYSGSTMYDTQARLFGLQVFNLTLGARIFDYGFVGVQLGLTDVEMLFAKVIQGYNVDRVNMFTQSYPIMLDFRGFFPINKDYHRRNYIFSCRM